MSTAAYDNRTGQLIIQLEVLLNLHNTEKIFIRLKGQNSIDLPCSLTNYAQQFPLNLESRPMSVNVLSETEPAYINTNIQNSVMNIQSFFHYQKKKKIQLFKKNLCNK